MKLLDTYLKYKKEYPDSIILIESGEFFEVLNDDSYLIHYFMGYKILAKNKFIHVGFPKRLLPSVMKEFHEFKLLIITKDKIINEGTDSKNYYDYYQKSKDYYDKESVINEIESMLYQFIDSKRFSKIVKQIKDILYG